MRGGLTVRPSYRSLLESCMSRPSNEVSDAYSLSNVGRCFYPFTARHCHTYPTLEALVRNWKDSRAFYPRRVSEVTHFIHKRESHSWEKALSSKLLSYTNVASDVHDSCTMRKISRSAETFKSQNRNASVIFHTIKKRKFVYP